LTGNLEGIVIVYQILHTKVIISKVDRAIFVLILTIVMCMSSGSNGLPSAIAIAIRKLQAADPADLF
jgi:hypothetical protein